jgi:hypothetical protein
MQQLLESEGIEVVENQIVNFENIFGNRQWVNSNQFSLINTLM